MLLAIHLMDIREHNSTPEDTGSVRRVSEHGTTGMNYYRVEKENLPIVKLERTKRPR